MSGGIIDGQCRGGIPTLRAGLIRSWPGGNTRERILTVNAEVPISVPRGTERCPRIIGGNATIYAVGANTMEKVYLKGGPFNGEEREATGDELIAQFPPGHARYKDSGEINQAGQRIFVYEPREVSPPPFAPKDQPSE